MVQIKNVAVFGAAGALGTPVLKVLLDSGKFNITIISREGSTSTFPPSAKVVRADYSSVESVTSALKGQDAVVSLVGTPGFAGQNIFVDAAIAAGVKRFLPSEFGSDLANPNTAALPVFAQKVAIRKYIEDKVKGGAEITYTFVENSAFLDWGVEHAFILNWKDGKPEIYNSGDQLLSATTLESVGIAVVGVLTHYEETKNRDVYIQDIAISQNKLLEIAQKADPERKLEPVRVNTADVLQASLASLAKGDYSFGVFAGFLLAGLFSEGYGQPFTKLDNELLGVPGKTEKDVEEIFRKVFSKKD